MGPEVAVFLVPITFFLAIAWIVKIISDNRTRRRLIDSGATERMVAALFAERKRDPNVPAALKWGLVAVSLGLSFIVVQLLPIRFEEPVAYGVMLLFAGGGLLVYYALAAKQEDERDTQRAARKAKASKRASPEAEAASEEQAVARESSPGGSGTI